MGREKGEAYGVCLNDMDNIKSISRFNEIIVINRHGGYDQFTNALLMNLSGKSIQSWYYVPRI